MKNNIPEFLQDKLNYKNNVQTRKFPDEIKQFMIDYAKFYNWHLDDDLRKILKVMKQGISTLAICGYNGCTNNVYFDGNMKMTVGCCREHSSKKSLLEKYGVENIFQLQETKEKIKKTNEMKFDGHPMKTILVQNKRVSTVLKNFGTTSPMKCEKIKAQRSSTNIKKYGCVCSLVSQKIKEKTVKTLIEKYGVTNPAQSDELKEKANKTRERKFGNANMFKTDYFVETTKKTNLIKYGTEHAPANYNLKEYTWKTGEKILLQGNEHIVLEELEISGYCYNDILTERKDMPKITYFQDGIEHRYYPDFYIPSENLIIEVKSEWTFNVQLEKNLKKIEAVKALGFNFRLEVRN